MKKLFYTFALLFIASALFLGCGARRANNATAVCEVSDVVLINGVAWATRNVARPGVFAATPESRGGHFTWANRYDVCPVGWRLPTQEELQLLNVAGYSWTTRGRVAGRLFGMPPNQIFLPAAGWRNNDHNNEIGNTGVINVVNTDFNDLARTIWLTRPTPTAFNLSNENVAGAYLGAYNNYTWAFSFNRDSSIVHTTSRHSIGFSVRCVQE